MKMELRQNISKRQKYIDMVLPFMNQSIIKVITGQRRVGKSYLLYQLINLILEKDKDASVIYINKEDLKFSFIKNALDLNEYVLSQKVSGKKNYVFIDEIQFFTPKFIQSIVYYLQKGVNFTLCGLEKDYLGQDFGSLSILKDLSSEYIILEGICELCNKPSTNTFRKSINTTLIIVGAKEEYSSLCNSCFEKELKKI